MRRIHSRGIRQRGVNGQRNEVAALAQSLGAIAHFDPTYGARDDGSTSTWIDRIAGHTVSGTGATRMTYSASASSLNNRPAWVGVNANGTHLTSTNGTLAALLGGANPFTIYSVAKQTVVSTQMVWAANSTSLSNHLINLYLNGGTYVVERQDGSAESSGSSADDIGNTPFVNVVTFDGSNVAGFNNGSNTKPSTAQVPRTPTLDRFMIGARKLGAGSVQYHWDGEIGDIIIFPTAHDNATRMQVEAAIARKYGWPVIQGLTGFTTTDYLKSAANAGIRGSNASGVSVDTLVRYDAIALAAEYPVANYETNKGFTPYHPPNSALTSFIARNGSTSVGSPAPAKTAAMVGRLRYESFTANLTDVYGFGNNVQLGTVALAGYEPTSSAAEMHVGRAMAATNAMVSASLFGISGGNTPHDLTDHQARAAAIKAAQKYVTTDGVAPDHAWTFDTIAATYADSVGSDTLTLYGTLTATQAIITSWSF